MKKFLSLISGLLAGIMLITFSPIYVRAEGNQSQFPSETNPFAVENRYLDPIDQDSPFIDVVLPAIRANIKENNKHSISPYYDAFPQANNPENFQGLGSTTYADINGETVTAEAFYRVRNEGLNDPNNGMGLLIYQCLEYKKAHPDEDVKITYSSYRTSVCASVCVLPESKYYGYMRSLYGVNYDEHGFVRISYLLTEAARMGIEVTLIHQLDSYSVQHYNPTTNSLKKRDILSHEKYFEQAMKSDCYNAYEPGKKVSDFMNTVTVKWQVGDNTTDMQHVKSASVSHYLATDGTEHKNAVFYSSSNLDENSYIGANGNNNAQSGVIISNHSELFRINYNYMQLMARYPNQEDMFTLRKKVSELNDEQIALILAGREHEIPRDEQIVYLGSENDPVFELYFTPLGGGADIWDTVKNPICKYSSKLPRSNDYVEVIWNVYGYGACHIGETMGKMFEKAFCENPNVKNKIFMRVAGFNTDAINRLSVGSQIGYRSISTGQIHAKDLLFSYEEEGKRHNVSIMTSCNYYMIAFNYRTNSMLVINETEDSGGNFYNIFGEAYSYGMINNTLMVDPGALALETGDSYKVDVKYSGKDKLTWTTSNKSVATVSADGTVMALKPGTATITVSDGTYKDTVKVEVTECKGCFDHNKGIVGNNSEQYVIPYNMSTMPNTFEAVFTLNKNQLTTTATIIGNDDGYEAGYSFSVNANGNPRMLIRPFPGAEAKQAYVFNQVNVATGKPVHLTIAMDYISNKIHCYVNGELKQSGKLVPHQPFKVKYDTVISGDYQNGNRLFFPGNLMSVAVWSDYRSDSEVANDYKKGLDYTDADLRAAYDFTRCEKHKMKDMSNRANDLEKVSLWLDKDAVEPVTDYEYSFAVVGDTQTMCEKDPEAMESLYDWILTNKKNHKIEYVIGLGDITDDSTDVEWDNAIQYINKLNNEIPYVLTRGNHDDWDDFNRYLHNGYYENTVTGMMNSGTISLTDINQPGLKQVVSDDDTISYVTLEGDQPEGGDVVGDLTNSYRYFSVQGTDYLILTLDFAPTQETLDWANSVIEAHPDHKVIAVTHAYMYRDGTTIDAADLYPPTYYVEGYKDQQNGDDMWAKCFSKHENVLMVLSGHDPWQSVVYRQDEGEKGNLVSQFLIDPQYVDSNNGATAMVAMFYFSNQGKTLTVRYYSIEKDCYGTLASQFTIDLDKHTHTYKCVSLASATLTETGEVTYICTTCGHEKTETLGNVVSFKAESLVYNGENQKPAIVITDSLGNVLEPDVDYLVEYPSNSKDVGSYKAEITLRGRYAGTKTVSYSIKPLDIKYCSVKLTKSTYTYDGKVKTPTVTVTNANGTKLTKDTHYTVTYASGRKKAGTYKVTVKMKGNYSGEKNLTFNINPITIDTCKLKLSATSYTYDGKVKTPTVTVTNANGTKLTKNTHYTVTYVSGRKNVGTYKVTIKGKGNYTGTKALTFKINPTKTTVSKLTAGKKSITVAITKKSTQVTGYQIQYSTSKTFSKSTTKTISSYKTTKYTLKSLSAKKTYYVRVRTYKTVGKTKYYSGWSTYKYVKTK